MAYFPNSSAGAILDNQCYKCPIPDDAPCPIIYVQTIYNYEQLDEDGKETKVTEVMNCLVNEKGICQMKPILEETIKLVVGRVPR